MMNINILIFWWID